ncbi:cobalamin binding intrinsic factor-like [Thalassophryne amazonica]|uniref:cobalamin binding intrinsic factor-like n=1 Tax=Thalassophryne amazonica TaxID=390379 RepID=UPI001470F59F|nr:cobalamin binding intrinsic factor-like [Thalassophryne amazonica]
MMLMLAFVSAALLLVTTGAQCDKIEMFPVHLVVKNRLLNIPMVNYSTEIAYRGILLGAMTRLKNSNAGFKFTYKEDPNYGPYLVSVNGVAENKEDRTFWELLAPNKTTGEIMRTDVGIGCYIPDPHEQIILNFTTW